MYIKRHKITYFKFLFLLALVYALSISISSTADTSSENEGEEQSYSQEIKSQYGTYEVLPLGNADEAHQSEKRGAPHSELQQTGIFVKAGQTLEVTVNNENPDLTITIGQYGSYSTLNDGVEVSFFTEKLHQGKNEIISEIDGMVYFKNRSVSLPSSIDLQGGQKVPFFIVNSTSKEEWLEMLQTMQDAPFVELKGEKMIGTFQLAENREILSTIDVNELLTYWDEVIELTDEVYGFVRGAEGTIGKANHPVHITNPDSGSGWASATHYRITFQVDSGAGKSVLTGGREDENWGLWHEVGHTYQTPEYRWYEMGEVQVNISAGYINRHYGIESRWTSSGNARNKVASMKEFIESTDENKHFDEMPYDNDTNLWLKFGMLEQLAFAYGDEFYKYLSQEYRNLGNVSVPSDHDKQQLFMRVTSKVINRNLTEFFTKWGLYPDEETQLELLVYPSLEVPIWNNIIYDTVEDYKLSSYSPPTANINGILDYTVGMNESEIELQDILTNIRNLNGENYEINVMLDVFHDFSKNASVEAILENSMGIKNRIKLPIKHNIGNAIVFKGYSNEQRLLLTLQPFTHTIETFTDSTLRSQFDTGDTHYATITLVDSELNELTKVEMNKNQSPQEFIDALSSIPYADGMLLKIEMANAGKLQLNTHQEVMMDFNEASKLEWFLISEDRFIRMGDLAADFKAGQTIIGEKIDAEDLIENITDTSELGDYSVSYKKEPNWNKVGEQAVTLLIKNKIGQEIEVKGSILISYSSSISMRAYGNEERVVLSTNKETGKLRSVSDQTRTTIIESTTGQYAEVTLYDSNLTSKYQTATLKENTPFEFAESLDGISYEEGDYIKFIMYSTKKLEMYTNGELSLNLAESNKEEWFQLIDHQFIRVPNIAPIAEPVTQTVLIGSKLSPSTFVKEIKDVFGEVEVAFASEPKWETFGEQKVQIRLTNNANIETIVESALIVSRGNSISLRGNLTTDERALVFLEPSSKTIQTFANPKESVVDSGSGLYWTLTHVSGESNEKIKEVSINREDTPFEFAEAFSGMNYENDDYVIVKHTRGSGFVRQYSENILQDQLFSNQEIFVIKENQFIRLPDIAPIAEPVTQTVLIGSKLSPSTFVKEIKDVFGEVEVAFASEPKWETFGEQKVQIRLTNNANIETIVESALIVSRGNSISLRGYATTDERALVFLEPSSKTIQTFTNSNGNVVDSGSGLYWTLTHVSGESNEKIKEVSINREDTPFEFAEAFSGMNYENNDYIIVEHTRGSGFVRQYSENSLQDQLFSKREIFVIKENQFIHVSSNTPTIQSDDGLVVKQNSKLTEAEFLRAIHFETELENQLVTNYTVDYLKVIGEYTIKIEVKNLITEETASKLVQLIVESPEAPPMGTLRMNYVSNFTFGKTVVSGFDKVYYAGLDSISNELGENTPTPNFVSIEDNRETNEAWQLKVIQNGQFVTDEGEELKGAELSFQDLNQMYDASTPLNLASGQALRIDHAVTIADASVGNETRNWSIAFGDTETGSKAIKLAVPGESKKVKEVQYKTTLTWDLGNTPL